MFGLKVAAPVYRIFKAVFLVLPEASIASVYVRCADGVARSFSSRSIRPLSKNLLKNSSSWAAFGQKVLDDIAEHIVGQLHVVFQIGERDFRLNHPEFSRMALRVGMLRAEGRPKRIDFAESHRHRFRLPADRKRSAMWNDQRNPG